LGRRDIPGKEGKKFVSQDGLTASVQALLDEIQSNLYNKALKFREENTHEPDDYDKFKEAVADGFARAWWCGNSECEAKIKEETKATNRCIPLDQETSKSGGTCIYCGKAANEKAIFGRAY